MPQINLSTPPRARWIETLINEHNWTAGAELGVQEGRIFLYLLDSCPNLTLHGADIWARKHVRLLENTDDVEEYDSINYQYYLNIKKLSEKHGDRAITHRMFTSEAALLVEDNSLDFIFVDADHSYDGAYNDIKTWWPKVKDTGWILGHDIDMAEVRRAVEELVPGYVTGPDNCWGRPKIIGDK